MIIELGNEENSLLKNKLDTFMVKNKKTNVHYQILFQIIIMNHFKFDIMRNLLKIMINLLLKR